MWIVNLNLRRFLMVVFCLISPDSGTCSLALHKHLVSVVVKRLNTFASRALSTLAPMFYIALRPVLANNRWLIKNKSDDKLFKPYCITSRLQLAKENVSGVNKSCTWNEYWCIRICNATENFSEIEKKKNKKRSAAIISVVYGLEMGQNWNPEKIQKNCRHLRVSRCPPLAL